MFSSVTNYLWWGSGASEEVDENKATDTPTNENVELMTTSADHEWELVDIPEDHNVCRKLTGQRFECDNGIWSEECPRVGDKLVPCPHQLSPQHGGQSSPKCISPEPHSGNCSSPSEGGSDHEGWFVTPRPCFTAGACHEDMEVSPLENLLIEHPSMSVYNMRVHSGKRKNKTQDTDSSENIDGPAAHTRSHHKKVGQPSHAPKRPKAVAARAGLIAQVEASSNKSGQRLQQLQKVGKSSKKSCDRQNKTRDFKSHGKHSNCNDRKMRPSGRMNIRAC